jgi:hypothetical protein
MSRSIHHARQTRTALDDAWILALTLIAQLTAVVWTGCPLGESARLAILGGGHLRTPNARVIRHLRHLTAGGDPHDLGTLRVCSHNILRQTEIQAAAPSGAVRVYAHHSPHFRTSRASTACCFSDGARRSQLRLRKALLPLTQPVDALQAKADVRTVIFRLSHYFRRCQSKN